MKEHWWIYTRKRSGVVCSVTIEVCVYATRQSMRRGVINHAKQMWGKGHTTKIDKKQIEGSDAMCRNWGEFVDGEHRPISRLFFCKETATPSIIAHEALHAALYAERYFSNNQKTNIRITCNGGAKTVSEEAIAMLIESVVRSVCLWVEKDYPDEL